MKFLITVTLVAASFYCNAQEQKKTEEPIYQYVEWMPEPGYDVKEYLQKSVSYPKQALKDSIKGKVAVKFVITETGALDHITVSKSAHPILDSEAVRVVRLMPAWKPGKQNGRAVRVYYTLPINFNF